MSKLRLPWQKRKEPSMDRRRFRNLFRRVFLSRDGVEILNILLTDWSFFDVCGTEQQRVLNDYAKVFLHDYLGFNGIAVHTDLGAEINDEED